MSQSGLRGQACPMDLDFAKLAQGDAKACASELAQRMIRLLANLVADTTFKQVLWSARTNLPDGLGLRQTGSRGLAFGKPRNVICASELGLRKPVCGDSFFDMFKSSSLPDGLGLRQTRLRRKCQKVVCASGSAHRTRPWANTLAEGMC